MIRKEYNMPPIKEEVPGGETAGEIIFRKVADGTITKILIGLLMI
jgi:hypothetical protein